MIWHDNCWTGLWSWYNIESILSTCSSSKTMRIQKTRVCLLYFLSCRYVNVDLMISILWSLQPQPTQNWCSNLAKQNWLGLGNPTEHYSKIKWPSSAKVFCVTDTFDIARTCQPRKYFSYHGFRFGHGISHPSLLCFQKIPHCNTIHCTPLVTNWILELLWSWLANVKVGSNQFARTWHLQKLNSSLHSSWWGEVGKILLRKGMICYSLDCFNCVDCILLRISYLVMIDKKVTATLY